MANETTTAGSNTPNAGMSMSPAARTLMRSREKTLYHYYNDMGKKKGNCTWGAGILAHKGICTAEELGRKVSAQMVAQEFDRRVGEAERAVRRNTSVPLTQEQFDALCSLAYNTGPTGASGTFDLVNSGNFDAVAENISKMTKVRVKQRGKSRLVVAPGLIQRRAQESAPFRSSPDPSKK